MLHSLVESLASIHNARIGQIYFDDVHKKQKRTVEYIFNDDDEEDRNDPKRQCQEGQYEGDDYYEDDDEVEHGYPYSAENELAEDTSGKNFIMLQFYGFKFSTSVRLF